MKEQLNTKTLIQNPEQPNKDLAMLDCSKLTTYQVKQENQEPHSQNESPFKPNYCTICLADLDYEKDTYQEYPYFLDYLTPKLNRNPTLCTLCQYLPTDPQLNWYDYVRSPNFSLYYRLPDEDGRTYFTTSKRSFLDFTRQTLQTFTCTLCQQLNIPFTQFEHHFQLDCPKLSVTCPQCKLHVCPRDELDSHLPLCPESQIQCDKCEQLMLRRVEKDHDCIKLLSDKLMRVNFESVILASKQEELEQLENRQKDEYKQVLLGILRANRKLEELNKQYGDEEQLMTQAFGSNFCRKCQGGVGHLMCSHCRDFICFACRRFCWRCIHKKEFNNYIDKAGSAQIQQSSFKTAKNRENNDPVTVTIDEVDPEIDMIITEQPLTREEQKNPQIHLNHSRQVTINLCPSCVAKCEVCKMNYCYKCKGCICNIYESLDN